MGGGIPIRRSSVEIISSCFLFRVFFHFRAVVSVIVIAFLSPEHYFITGFYSYFYFYGLLLKLSDDDDADEKTSKCGYWQNSKWVRFS